MSTDVAAAQAQSKIDLTKKKNEEINKKSLEEDDEFEDFPIDTWAYGETIKSNAVTQTNIWEENWDDVEVDDDFTNELKAELDRYKRENQ
ncbi:CGH_1_collapsed_G0011980.mRNA.1.CDS.1 [Saccharomyces cerevisiae]|nr:CGH_1_HP_G0053190.mRNA.1.CDS.1 [Saccharomyces cerevisiae]CAI5003263.1 CGH_1_HP_G0077290.mRNA.1.CDS.1 [Saccharomyces cerevisiae]CAI5047742.1 CGH_1_HP_G0110370.mRNA.1.CDS.1 [Saccharomyces cerevisiae]CAI6766415.1 CGH_1_HP_G0053190.mRNA.1.CDS.1 [Saccharomyces cerevisiae]CAI6917745.1 CGH_1_HP_G0077290.mRNA.1.CDS.1 [Saccharomyces cerevisiae]